MSEMGSTTPSARRSWRCRLGWHRWRSAGWQSERSRFNRCERKTVYVERGGWRVPVPLERCTECRAERVMSCYVVPSAEVSNPLARPPRYDCVCGKGNEAHRSEWFERRERLVERLRAELQRPG